MWVEYCPTGEMTIDFFTKPLQGSFFHKFHAEILSLDHDPLPDQKECVGTPGMDMETGGSDVEAAAESAPESELKQMKQQSYVHPVRGLITSTCQQPQVVTPA